MNIQERPASHRATLSTLARANLHFTTDTPKRTNLISDQSGRVLEYLFTNKYLTTLQAHDILMVTELAESITELRILGLSITTVWDVAETVNGEDCRIAKYALVSFCSGGNQ